MFWWMSCTVLLTFELNLSLCEIDLYCSFIINIWAVRPCAGCSWPNGEQQVLPYPAFSKDTEAAESSCTPQTLPCPKSASACKVKGSLVRLTPDSIMLLSHHSVWLFSEHGLYAAFLCSSMPQILPQQTLINVAWLVILLKIFRFPLLIP